MLMPHLFGSGVGVASRCKVLSHCCGGKTSEFVRITLESVESVSQNQNIYEAPQVQQRFEKVFFQPETTSTIGWNMF